jgi:DNA helicase-2/ATP-dependent DNA helicase PcrA
MQKILTESGYLKMLKESKTIEDESRAETLEELVNALRDFDNVREFLDYVSLVLDNSDSSLSDKITISTIHAAKGLEYDTVFIPGFEENIIPHQMSIAEKGEVGVEEERRLCYVALTRARVEAFITMCQSRKTYGYGTEQIAHPSRFLYDLPKDSVRVM